MFEALLAVDEPLLDTAPRVAHPLVRGSHRGEAFHAMFVSAIAIAFQFQTPLPLALVGRDREAAAVKPRHHLLARVARAIFIAHVSCHALIPFILAADGIPVR